MKFGCCSSFSAADERFVQAGGDFIETCINAVDRYTPEERAAADAFVAAHPGSVLAANGALPWKDCKCVGPDAQDFTDYFARIVPVLAGWGVKQLIFGSGGARRIPDGYPREKAEEEFLRAFRACCDAAAPFGLKAAIEPLRFTETNLANTVKEAAELAERAERPNVNLHLDLFHVAQNGELLSDIRPFISRLGHIHVANPAHRGRMQPGDHADYKSFFNLLREEGFDGTVSYEGSSLQGGSDAWREMYDFLRTL